MAHARTVLLNARQPVDESEVGPKAMSLIRMSRAGLAVPAGFCVTQTVLRDHLEHNNLADRPRLLVDEIAEAEPLARKTALSDLRQLIAEAPLREQTRREIESLYSELDDTHIVRDIRVVAVSGHPVARVEA